MLFFSSFFFKKKALKLFGYAANYFFSSKVLDPVFIYSETDYIHFVETTTKSTIHLVVMDFNLHPLDKCIYS